MPKGGIASYPSIYQLGHPASLGIMDDDVLVEAKIDGSQASIMLEESGELRLRSKNQEIEPSSSGMFDKLVETAEKLKPLLTPGWVYRGEYLSKPHHNAITYARVPAHNFILFDIMTSYENYMPREEKEIEAARLGLELVPVLHRGRIASVEQLEGLIGWSILGGTRDEGVVIKNYARFGKDKKCLMAKYVRPEFKELNKSEWSKTNPSPTAVVDNIILGLRNEARWAKAVQHMREMNLLEDRPQDLAKLVPELKNDIEKECKEEILEALWKHYWPKIQRGVMVGFPEYYKRTLAEKAFAEEPNNETE
jgi:hypothetical protein